MMRNILIVLMLWSTFSFCQEDTEETTKEDKIKTFISFKGKKSFLLNDTRYFNFDFGLKVKCKYKLGFSYGNLKGTFKTQDYPVNISDYPNSTGGTKSDLKMYSVLVEPIIFKHKKVNISIPVHLGITELTSDYQTGPLSYTNYHLSNPLFADIAFDFDFRFLGFMKLGLGIGYRYVASELEVASSTFSTPLLGFGVKIGGMCKN